MKIRFDELEACPPVAFTDDIPSKPGVYLFLEGTAVERVGRSNNLKSGYAAIYKRTTTPVPMPLSEPETSSD